MNELDLTYLITHHPERKEFTVACLRAFCMKESSNNPLAYKPEPTYKWLMGDPGAMSVTELWGQRMSWGLMQVMGAVAREHGFKGRFFTELCDPEVGLYYGIKHLRGYCKRYHTWPDIIAAYNAGSPRKNDAGLYVNQDYVDSVLKYWSQYEPKLDLKESEA